jgi:hypothetical protein
MPQPTNQLLSVLPPNIRRKLLIQQEPVRLEPSTALSSTGEYPTCLLSDRLSCLATDRAVR